MRVKWHYGFAAVMALGALHCSDSTGEPEGGNTGGTGAAGAGGVGGSANPTGGTGGTSGATGGGSGGVGSAGSDAGVDGGEDAGARCEPGYFGPTCAKCTCGPNGNCDDGIDGTGECSCDTGWAGDQCDVCASGHYGATCSSICTCSVHGTCDQGLSGTGACTCEDGWGGINCQTCAPGRYGSNCESTCPACSFGECEAGQSGSGQCCITAGAGEHVNQEIAAQTGSFSVEWDGSASAQTDAIFGLTVDNTANDWDDFAVAVRFNPQGQIDARDGAAYNSDASLPYSGGEEIHFRMAVDLTTHTYSVWATPSGGAEVQIAADYDFRPVLNTATELRNAAARLQTNRQPIRICNFAIVD